MFKLGGRPLPKAIKPERLKELVPKLRAGTASTEEKHEIINGFLRWAVHIVGKFVSSQSHPDFDDLVSIAFLTLSKEVERAGSKLKDDDLESYIGFRLSRRCKDAWAINNIYGPKKSSIRQHKGNPRVTIQRHSVDDVTLFAKVDLSPVEFEELISVYAHTPIEKEILRLRYLDYNDEEIASFFDWVKSTVWSIRNKVVKRMEAANEFGEEGISNKASPKASSL